MGRAGPAVLLPQAVPAAALPAFGPPTIAAPWLHLSPPQQTGLEAAALQAMLASGWLGPGGPHANELEASLVQTTGFRHVIATSSGTAALQLGYRALGLQPGDEVWTSTLTFIATIAPAVQMGARPRFLDVHPESWTLDPALLQRELARAARRGRLPRVVVPVDLFGQCANLPEILTVCDQWGVPVMADAAQSLGSSQHGRPAGRGARLAAFSFNGNKIITGGGGGALASDDPALIDAARHLANQAKDTAPYYLHSTTGHNFTIPAPVAAICLAQLPMLAQRVAARRAVFARYRAGLGSLPGITFMPEPAWGHSSRWLTALRINPKLFGAEPEAVRLALADARIEARPMLLPLHRQPAFQGAARAGGSMAEWLFLEGLCLPSGGAMTPAQQARVIATIRDCGRF